MVATSMRSEEVYTDASNPTRERILVRFGNGEWGFPYGVWEPGSGEWLAMRVKLTDAKKLLEGFTRKK